MYMCTKVFVGRYGGIHLCRQRLEDDFRVIPQALPT